MSVGVVELLVLLLAGAPIVLMLMALIDLSQASDEQMIQAGFNRYVWLAIIVVLPMIGSIAYFVVARHKIRGAGAPKADSLPAGKH